MIAHLQGTLAEKSPTRIVIECSGVGYSVAIPVSVAEKLPEPGKVIKVLTILNVREDAMELYGFNEPAERATFLLLTSIPGIGPKIALGILSSISMADLRDAILRQDIPRLQKLPGVGKKTAERLAMELRDKIDKLEISGPAAGGGIPAGASSIREEALAALLALGYSKPAGEKAIRKVLESEPEAGAHVEQVIRKALRAVG